MTEIVICAAHSVTRAGLCAMVTMPTTQVVEQISSVEALSQWLQTQHADLAVIVTTDGFETVLQIVDSLGMEDDLSVLLLLDDEWIEIAETASVVLSQLMSSGLVSLLPMDVSADEIRSAIAAIVSGFTVLHPAFTEALFNQTEQSFVPTEDELEPLTPREIEVLNQLAGGLTNRAIAKTLKISEHTVKFHISAILSKLNVASRTKAVAVGIRTGLVML